MHLAALVGVAKEPLHYRYLTVTLPLHYRYLAALVGVEKEPHRLPQLEHWLFDARHLDSPKAAGPIPATLEAGRLARGPEVVAGRPMGLSSAPGSAELPRTARCALRRHDSHARAPCCQGLSHLSLSLDEAAQPEERAGYRRHVHVERRPLPLRGLSK